jgi:hypothetical protein
MIPLLILTLLFAGWPAGSPDQASAEMLRELRERNIQGDIAATAPEPVVVSPEQVEQALARGPAGEEKTLRLSVQSDEDADHIIVRMNAEQILAVTDDNKRNLVVFDTPLGEISFIPMVEGLPEAAEEHGVGMEEIWFEVAIGKTSADEAEHIRQAAETQGMTLLTDPIAVDMGFEANGELLPDEGVVGYFTQWLSAEPVLDQDNSSGMVYDPKYDFFEFMPAVSSTLDGRQMVTMMVSDYGYFFIVKKEIAFSDVIDDIYRPAVNRLVARGVIEGNGDGTFHPDRLLTRAEAAAMFSRFYALVEEGDAELAAEAFEDVDADDWFAGYVGAMYREGYLKGNRFNPHGHVTADEIYAAFLVDETVQYLFSFLGERIESDGPHVTRAEGALIFDQMARAYELSVERARQRSLQG